MAWAFLEMQFPPPDSYRGLYLFLFKEKRKRISLLSGLKSKL
jgi:hypothetical protein